MYNWDRIKRLLNEAKAMLPQEARIEKDIIDYQEYIDNNELELAWNALDNAGGKVFKDADLNIHFWMKTAEAASLMQMDEE